MVDIKIISEKSQPLLKRKIVNGEFSFEGATLSKVELKKLLAAKLKQAEDVVLVRFIRTGFGVNKAVFEAYVYESKQALEALVPKKKEKKKDGEEKAKAGK